MPDSSPILALPYLMPAQAQKHVTHNEALRRLDIIVQLSVESFDADTPPDLPVEGEVFALGDSATGAWAGHDGDLAVSLDSAWHFVTPRTGWRAWGRTQAQLRIWDGSAWVLPMMAQDNLSGLGIGTSADTVNRLAVMAQATLLTHDGAGHQLKINKAAGGDTASVLFQSGWSGHAEMGLAGTKDFSIKVSGDGAAWTQALSLDRDTGLASGAAVQSDTSDATAGRLLTVGAFGLGETDTAPLLEDLDATDRPAGLYRMTSTSLNRPAGPNTGVVAIQRQNSDGFAQTVTFNDGTSTGRYCASGSFTAWSTQYGSGNLLGPVSQSGGTPTGAVIEHGSNGNGDYVRFANGTQICTNSNTAITTSPASFAGTITKIDGDKLWIGRWF